MKILFDPVMTNRPSVCSTMYLVWELIETIIKARDDVFFYVLYPPNKCDEADKEFLSRHSDRVTLLPLVSSTTDRASELYMLRNTLRKYLNPWSADCWDFDVVVSSRIPVLKHFVTHYSRAMGSKMPSLRLTVGIDEMPVLSFRDTVPWHDYLTPDTVMSYAQADAVLINNQWTKASLRPLLRDILSPSFQRRVLDRIHEVVPVRLGRLNVKAPEDQYQSGDFNVTFVGRVTSTRNFKQAADLFRKHFSFPIGKNKENMKFLISTNSESTGSSNFGETDFVDFQFNDREKFHQFLKAAHVAVNLTHTEDFSLSTYETLMAGVPVLVLDQPWNAFLGADYPFRAKNQVEAYTILRSMAEDYEREYTKFVEWEATYWAGYVASDKNITTGEKLLDLIEDFEARRTEYTSEIGGSYVGVIQEKFGLDAPEIDLTKHLEDQKYLFKEVEDSFSLPLGRVPGTLMLKLVAERLGYRDTNKVGVMKK